MTLNRFYSSWPQRLEVAGTQQGTERRNEGEPGMQWGDCLKLNIPRGKGGIRTSERGKKECAAVQRERGGG